MSKSAMNFKKRFVYVISAIIGVIIISAIAFQIFIGITNAHTKKYISQQYKKIPQLTYLHRSNQQFIGYSGDDPPTWNFIYTYKQTELQVYSSEKNLLSAYGYEISDSAPPSNVDSMPFFMAENKTNKIEMQISLDTKTLEVEVWET
jgi:hypothetical protein